LGFWDWVLGIGPNPQSPIPNPQSPIPNFNEDYKNLKELNNLFFFKIFMIRENKILKFNSN